jgi:hypothetical protein
MGTGVGMGIHKANIKKVFGWLWHALREAQREVPLLRWLGLLALVCAGSAAFLAVSEGKTKLDMAVYGGTVLLFALDLPVIYYLLFEIYRKHRSDAIYDSRRLADLIRRIANEEMELRLGQETAANTAFLVPPAERAAFDGGR